MEKDKTFFEKIIRNKMKDQVRFPDKHEAEKFIENVYRFLFIRKSSEERASDSQLAFEQLRNRFAALLAEKIKDKKRIWEHEEAFFGELPQLYDDLLNDAGAILEFDPAAESLAEVIVTYPGFYATVIYRLSHQLWTQGLRLLPRLFTEYAHSKTGIDIHPGALIGEAFAIDHGTGIVIGETTVIGNYVKIYQGVTLGALNVEKREAKSKRHPTIEDRVIIYSGATILGGSTIIGQGSIIGGNVWITRSVPANSVVYHKSEIRIKDKEPFPEVVSFEI